MRAIFYVRPKEVLEMAEEFMSGRYSPDRKGLMLKYGSIAATGIIAGGSMISLGACSKREQWAETSGKAGQINMEAVEKAMEKSKDVSEFEKKVNEIYTGKEMVLVEVENKGKEQLVSGYADLNNNLKIDSDSDDKLFTFRRWFEGDKPRYEMRGHGMNSYYHHPYPAGTNLLTTYLLVSALTRPRYAMPVYHTTMGQRQATQQYRTNYRQTPSYRNQVSSNKRFQTRMSSKHGTTYRKASPNASRTKWAQSKGVNLNKATKSSRSFSRSGSRSSWGGRTSRGTSGFRGGTAGAGIGLLCRAKLSQ